MKTNELTFTKIDTEKRYHMINLNGERMGNYKIANNITGKWENTLSSSDGCGNVHYECTFDLENKKIKWTTKDKDWSKDLSFYNIIDSPLLLYRLISVFHSTPEVVTDPYKTIWWFSLKHKKTNKKLTFGEWKGTSGFWLPEHTHTQLKKEFKEDMEELLLFLISDQIPHPYDHCTAGQIA
jgi:hypothetical protein